MSWLRAGELLNSILRTTQELPRPWGHEVRVAALEPWFPVRGRPKVFEQASFPDLNAYRPHVLAGPVPALVGLAEAVIGNLARFPELNRGVVAWSGIGRPVLKPAERDLLWLAFQVPVFEEFRSWSGEPLAWECDAHDGLHISAERAFFERDLFSNELRVAVASAGFLPTGLDGRVVDEPCPCGLHGPRLVSLRSREQPILLPVTAGA